MLYNSLAAKPRGTGLRQYWEGTKPVSACFLRVVQQSAEKSASFPKNTAELPTTSGSKAHAGFSFAAVAQRHSPFSIATLHIDLSRSSSLSQPEVCRLARISDLHETGYSKSEAISSRKLHLISERRFALNGFNPCDRSSQDGLSFPLNLMERDDNSEMKQLQDEQQQWLSDPIAQAEYQNYLEEQQNEQH